MPWKTMPRSCRTFSAGNLHCTQVSVIIFILQREHTRYRNYPQPLCSALASSKVSVGSIPSVFGAGCSEVRLPSFSATGVTEVTQRGHSLCGRDRLATTRASRMHPCAGG